MPVHCPRCGFRFEGVASHCPRCEAPLPATRLSAPALAASTLPGTGRTDSALSSRQRWLCGGLAVLAAGAAFFLVVGLAFLLYFCLDLDLFQDDRVNDCADEEAAAARLVYGLGIPLALLVGGLTYWLLQRVVRRRNLRRRQPLS